MPDPVRAAGGPVTHVSNTNAYRHPEGEDEERLCAALLAEIEQAIDTEGAETIAMLIAEPVQNAGGSIVPPDGYWAGLREICDRHGILLCLRRGDLRLRPARALVRRRALRLRARPDHIRQGTDRGPLLDGRGVDLRPGRRALPRRPQPTTCTATPSAATRSAPRSPWRRSRRSRARVCSRTSAPTRRSPLKRSNGLRDIPIVGDVRGAGYFWAIELVRDQETRASFDGPAADWLLKDVLSEELWSRGLICRLDDRTEPIIQIAPPLVADAP